MQKLVVTIAHAAGDPGSATLGFLSAGAALHAGIETIVVLRGEGVLLAATEGWAAGLREVGYPPLHEVRDAFVSDGGRVYLSELCARKYKLAETEGLLPGAVLANVHELLALHNEATVMHF